MTRHSNPMQLRQPRSRPGSLCASILLLAIGLPGGAWGNPVENLTTRDWVRAAFEDGTASPPFSFTLDGKPSADFLKTWPVERASRSLDPQRTEQTCQYRDPATGLLVRCVAVEYLDFPAVEWTVHLKNTGAVDTPLIADIQALDTQLTRETKGEFTLHHWSGSSCTPHDYEPQATTLDPKAALGIATSGGRPTDANMPYFNVEWAGAGVIAALGWPGQWAAHFDRDAGAGLRVRGGQELTHLKLHPGEEIRTPLVVLQFYKGDWIGGQNIWRRWMIAHNLPRPGGKLLATSLMMCTSDFYPGMQSTADGEKKYIDAYVNGGVKLDYWWIDAGWYPCDGAGWEKTGTWEPDPKRYPKGIREVADYVHGKGMKLVVWFEPERVHAGTWLADQHPEWVLGGSGGGLLDLGNDKAREWLTDHVDRMLTSQGIDLYRQDFNMEPLGFWRRNDAPDRQGMTEIRHVVGYLAYWDELRRRHPNMPIDTCASGGRRNDLETLRRAVPLLRSDYRGDAASMQGHTYGMSSWIPYYGTGIGDQDEYVVRSQWCPWLGIGRSDPEKPGLDWTRYHRLVAEWRESADLMLGDYYPLTPYSLDESVWMAWQFDRPEQGDGMVQAFRHSQSIYESARMKLRGLDTNATYAVTDIDTGVTQRIEGRELMDKGLLIVASSAPRAVVIMYRKAP